jgi:hypothetical protein
MNSISTDDYGELDVSLQSYKSTSSGSKSLGITREETREKLHDHLKLFPPCMGGQNLTVTKNGQCQFKSGELRIDIGMRDDRNAFIISCVVFSMKYRSVLLGGEGGRGSRGVLTSYFLLTKTMKFNTTLNRVGKGQIGQYDGQFVYFRNEESSCIYDPRCFRDLMEDYLLTALVLRKDLQQTTTNKMKSHPFHLL